MRTGDKSGGTEAGPEQQMPERGRTAERKRLSAQVANHILAAIDAKIYAPGDRLPPERALAEQMRVSRNSVREALSALELSGIVEARVGAGTFVVRTPSAETDFDRALTTVDIGFDAIEMWEANCELETVVIGLAADRATSKDHEALDDIRRKIAAETRTPNGDNLLNLNWVFRQALAQATGNGPLRALQAALHRLTEKGDVRALAAEALHRNPTASEEAHNSMLLAVRLRDRDAGEEAVRQYYAILRRHLAEKYLGKHGKADSA